MSYAARSADGSATGLQPSNAGRILAPDLARGMMLLFIAVANVSVYLWGRQTPEYSVHPVGEGPLDTALSTIAIVFVDGHVYPMFAFLFGYGITQFAYSRIARGVTPESVGRMLLRRHLWMLLFGAVHALLLFSGDILGAYALTGLALATLLLRGGERLIRTLLWVIGGVCAGFMLLGALALLVFGMLVPPELMQTPPELEASLPGTADLMAGIENFWLAMAARIGLWIVSSIGAVLSLIIPFAVLLGGLAARHRWLEGLSPRMPLPAVAAAGIAIGALGSLPSALVHLQILPDNLLIAMGWTIVAQLCGVAGGIGYAALFALIGLRDGDAANPVVGAIAAVGKRSLSFYLLQSIVFAPLLSAWGFGLGADLGTGGAYLLALGVWLLSIAVAVWLERTGRRGPAEAVLRGLTYGREDVARPV